LIRTKSFFGLSLNFLSWSR